MPMCTAAAAAAVVAVVVLVPKFQSSKMGQGDLSPRGLRPQCGSISHPLWFQSRLDTQWESTKFFYKSRNILDCCSIYICGYRSGFPHILILSVAK